MESTRGKSSVDWKRDMCSSETGGKDKTEGPDEDVSVVA